MIQQYIPHWRIIVLFIVVYIISRVMLVMIFKANERKEPFNQKMEVRIVLFNLTSQYAILILAGYSAAYILVDVLSTAIVKIFY